MALFPASITELFSSRAAPAPLSPAQIAAGNNPGVQGQQQAAPTVGPDGNPLVPNANTPVSDGSVNAIPAASVGAASPLENYKDLWQAPANTVSMQDLVPTIIADPAQMQAAAAKMDFSKAMNPELVTKALGGDSTAFMAVINSAVQASFAQAATASVNITKAALAEQAKSFETKYAPNMLRNASIQDAVNNSVALASDPAAAPIVNAVKAQLSNMFPNATATEIAEHTNKYMSEFASKAVELAGGKIQTKADLETTTMGGPLSRKDVDWSVLIG